MKREGNGRRVAACRIRIGSQRVHDIPAAEVSVLALGEGDRYLASTVCVAAGIVHAAKGGRDMSAISSIIDRGEGHVGLLFGTGLRSERTDGFPVTSVQSHLVTSVLRKGDSLSTTTHQGMCHIIGEAAAIGLRVRSANGDRHHGRPTSRCHLHSHRSHRRRARA